MELTKISCNFQGTNELNQKLLQSIVESREIHLVPCKLDDRFVLRLAICARTAESHHMHRAWQHITKLASQLIKECGPAVSEK